MKKRTLGNSSLQVSELGLGCMSLPADLQEAKSVIDAAIDGGINFFDTADLYAKGVNEEVVGNILRSRRHDLVVASKVGNKLLSSGESWEWDASKEYIMEAVKKSLSRLQTDYIDLYQLHGGTMEDNAEDTIDAFETLKQEGVVREYGISSIRPTVIHRFLKLGNPVSVMMQYSLLDRRPEEWFPMIQEHGASVITRGTIAKGLLSDEGIQRAADAPGFAEYGASELQETVAQLSNETDNLQAAALAFALAEPVVATALIGSRTADQLEQTLEAYEQSCSSDVLKKLKKLATPHQYKEHRLD